MPDITVSSIYYTTDTTDNTAVVTGSVESLRSVVIPNTVIGFNVTSIATSAFENRQTNGLTSITIPQSVTSIGNWAFSYARGLASINIPSGVTQYSGRDFKNTSISYILYNDNNTMLLYYPSSLTATEFTIPNGVTTISDYAFQGVNNLTSITIPEGD